MSKPGRIALVVLVGVAATAAAYAAALAVLPWVLKQLFAGYSGGVLSYGYYQGSVVFLCCLFGGLAQAAVLTVSRTARADIAIATALGSAGAWSLQAYAVAFRDVGGYPFSGHFGLINPRGVTAGDFIIYVTGGFVLVGVCQALTIHRSAALAVFWPAVWLLGGLAFAFAVSEWSPTFEATSHNLILVGSGAFLGLIASVAVFVPFGIRLPYPRALPAPIASAAGAIALVAMVLGGGYLASAILFGPIDDPGSFCGAPDPNPAPGIAASIILQECAAGKTFTVQRGQTIAIDLQVSHGIDTSSTWVDFSVSNGSVLGTVTPPETVGTLRRREDEIALYQARRSGEATISGVQMSCTGNFGGGCGRGLRWSVTIHVT